MAEGTRFSQYPEKTEANVDDYFLVYDVTTSQVKRIKQRNAVGVADFGWTASGETWTFSSYDSAKKLGVVNVPIGADAKYSVGMRVRFEQPTNGTKYGVLTSVGTASLTFRLGTGTTLDNEAITNPVYSSLYEPYGLPGNLQLTPVKTTDANGWTVYDYGAWKKYAYNKPGSGPAVASKTGQIITTIGLPAGFTDRTTVNTLWSIYSGNQEIAYTQSNDENTNTLVFRAYNNHPSASITPAWRVNVELTDK